MTLKVTKWFPYKEKKDELIQLVPNDTYRVIGTSELYNIIPSGMHSYLKHNVLGDQHMVVKRVDEESSATFAFSNITRVDYEQNEYVINEDQWAVVWLSGQSSASDSGAFLQHGNYPDRTRPIKDSVKFVKNALASGLQVHIPISKIPIKPSGNINELISTSHWYAGDALAEWVKGLQEKHNKK